MITTQQDVTTVLRELRKLAEDWSKPKTLREIHALMGRFPFKVKAVVEGTKAPDHTASPVPVGTVVEIIAPGIVASDHFLSDYRPNRVQCEIWNIIPRWMLIED